MALKEYEVSVNGIKHTLQLDEAGAKRLNLKDSDAKRSVKPAEAPLAKDGEPNPKAPKGATAENKAGTAENK